MLKLDVPQILGDLDAELGQNEKFREPPPLTNRPRGILDYLTLWFSRMNWRITVALIALLFFLALTVAVIKSHTRKPENPLKDLGPGLYQPPKGSSGETLPLPPPKR